MNAKSQTQESSTNSRPYITGIDPPFALPGGEVRIVGRHLIGKEFSRPEVRIGKTEAGITLASSTLIVAKMPVRPDSSELTVCTPSASNAVKVGVASEIADDLHPVSNPAVDAEGNIYVSFSGARGQAVPVSVYKVRPGLAVQPFVSELMNATGLALDAAGYLYVSSRYDGTVYRVSPNGSRATYAQGMGVATGIAFDPEENLYVGDRSGTIFKIARDRQIYVFATLEPSVSAYHLAFAPSGNLYVTGPTISSFDAVYEIDPHGSVREFYRGLGRPQGIAFDVDGNLYVAASLRGRRGIVRLTPAGEPSLILSGSNLVGLAFVPGKAVILATSNAVHHLEWGIMGQPLWG
ncbi:MAG: IPT/TIG domain-containing protein [Candidatus Korobacteraceae bacterium]